MWIKKAFNILQITKTTNKRKIALAYKKLLLFQSDKQVLLYQIPSGALSTSNTPAEKTVEEEKEYLKFQQAYETAIAYATKREEKERISKDTEDFEDTEISKKEEQISTQSKHIMADEVPAPPDYINFIYKDIITSDEYTAIKDLSNLFQLVTNSDNKDNEPVLKEKIAEVFHIENTLSVTEQAERIIKKYPEGFFVKILAVSILEKYESSNEANHKRIAELNSEIWEGFFDTYVKDETFLFSEYEYINGAQLSKMSMEVIQYTKAGEYFLAGAYLEENLQELKNYHNIPLEKENDKLLAMAYLDIMKAKAAKSRSDAVKLWHKADKILETILQTEPEQKNALILKMLAGVELYDFDKVAACYDKAVEQMKENPYVYMLMAESYLMIRNTKDAKIVFETAKENHATCYGLQILHLHFRKSYDFIDGYDLTEALEEGRALLTSMMKQEVSRELSAEMYYALAYLIYCDGRQTSSVQCYNLIYCDGRQNPSVHFYITKALSLCEKPKYYFLAAMNYISNGNNEYASAQPLFEKVYQMKEWWDDGESNNPRFAGESDYDGSIWLNSCDRTDLYNLYVKLGYCNEINQSYADAIDYYTKALLIMPDKMKVAVGFARVAEILFHKKDVSQDVEQYMEELSEETLELLPCKWLRAELAFDEGDDELTLKLVNEIVKVKLSGDYIDSQLRDYVHFANHLKVKVYMEREKYQIAKKYLGNLLESLKNHKNRGMRENANRTKQIYLDAIEWYTELGNHAEAEEVKRELDSLRF